METFTIVHLSPTGVAVMLMTALCIDYMSIGPASIRDRIAFCIALPCFYTGFNGSQVDRYTVGLLSSWIDTGKEASGDAYIAQAVTSTVIGAGVALLALYVVGVMLPDKLAGKLGPMARFGFKEYGVWRINMQLWPCAFFLGILCDLPGGILGDLIMGFVAITSNLVAILPGFLFGA